MIDFKPYFQTLKSSWYGIITLFILFVVGIYISTWTFIEPLSIPDDFDKNEMPDFIFTRRFWHLLIVLFSSSYLTLIFDLIHRQRHRNEYTTNRLSTNKDDKAILILSGNKISIKVIEKSIQTGYIVKGIYDLNPNAEGILLARKNNIQTYVNNMSEMRKMLQLCTDNQNICFYIFMTTEYQNFVTRADEVLRSLRRHTKNFRVYHLGIEFDENIDEIELSKLMT